MATSNATPWAKKIFIDEITIGANAPCRPGVEGHCWYRPISIFI